MHSFEHYQPLLLDESETESTPATSPVITQSARFIDPTAVLESLYGQSL